MHAFWEGLGNLSMTSLSIFTLKGNIHHALIKCPYRSFNCVTGYYNKLTTAF